MTWQTVVVIALAVLLFVAVIGALSWQETCKTRRHISDNQLKNAQVPRSIFGSGMSPPTSVPISPAAAHHSGGIGKARIQRPS